MSIIRAEIKTLLAKENISMTELAEKATEKTGKKLTVNGLSRKLVKGTLSFNEAAELASVLGYSIKFEKNS